MIDNVALRDEYFNRFTDLQYKKRKDKNDVALLMLLCMLFIEYLSNLNTEVVSLYAPFIPRIKNIDNPKVVINAIEKALGGNGKLVHEITYVRRNMQHTITTISNTIIPQKSPKVDVESDYIREMKERTDYLESNNQASLMLNKQMLQKKNKVWNTQADNKVRKTAFHSGIHGQVKAIDSFFEVNGITAQYPADSILPNWERLNCRCYLTYF